MGPGRAGRPARSAGWATGDMDSQPPERGSASVLNSKPEPFRFKLPGGSPRPPACVREMTENRPRNRNPKKPENSSKRCPKWRRKSTPNRQKWALGPLPMASSILNPFWDRPREGLCAPNIANNVSNSHRALVQKVPFWLPFGLHFGAFGPPFALF